MNTGKLSGKTILIVDDEELMRAGVAKGLERRGCKTVQASSGSEALKLIMDSGGDSHFDAVITDMRMPNGNGVELLDAIKKKNVNVPVTFIMTGFSDVAEPELLSKGAEAVFQKPFSRKTLEDALERLLTAPIERLKPGMDERAKSAVDAQMNFQFASVDDAIKGSLLEVGRGGIFVRIEDKLPRHGALVSFTVQCKDGPLLLIEGKGHVRWARAKSQENLPSGCGIEFVELSEGCREQVVRWLGLSNLKAYIPIR